MKVKLTFFLLIIFIYKTNAGVYECSNNDDCIDPSAECKESFCKCPVGTDYNKEGTKCLKLAAAYGDSCEDDAQCSLLTGLTECKNGECVCTGDYVYLKGKCRRKKSFDDYCLDDEECFLGGFYNSRKCENNKCVCVPGFYKRDGIDCMPEGKKIGDLCLIDEDCKIPDSFCDSGICNAIDGNRAQIVKVGINFTKEKDDSEEVLSKMQSHLTIYRDIKCNSNEDCSLPNTYCSTVFNTCVCEKGYYFQDGRCKSELGTKCTGDRDCEIKNSECRDGKCLCKTQPFLYVMNSNNRKCLKPATAPYFYCIEDESCKSFSSNYECFDGPEQRSCKCKPGYSSNEYNICKYVGGICLKDEDCGSFSPNSVCASTKYCVCKENYSFIDNACRANIGAPCVSPRDCVIPNSTCTNTKTCSCDIGFAAATPTMCKKVSGGLDYNCDYNVECSAKVSGSECKDGVCTCSEGFMKIDKGCYKKAKKMGDYCVLPQTCTNGLGGNVQCRNSQCQCGVGMKLTVNGSDCESKGFTTKATCSLTLLFVAIAPLLFS